jgi:hypothetical protein
MVCHLSVSGLYPADSKILKTELFLDLNNLQFLFDVQSGEIFDEFFQKIKPAVSTFKRYVTLEQKRSNIPQLILQSMSISSFLS